MTLSAPVISASSGVARPLRVKPWKPRFEPAECSHLPWLRVVVSQPMESRRAKPSPLTPIPASHAISPFVLAAAAICGRCVRRPRLDWDSACTITGVVGVGLTDVVWLVFQAVASSVGIAGRIAHAAPPIRDASTGTSHRNGTSSTADGAWRRPELPAITDLP